VVRLRESERRLRHRARCRLCVCVCVCVCVSLKSKMASINEQYPLPMSVIPGYRYTAPGVQIGQCVKYLARYATSSMVDGSFIDCCIRRRYVDANCPDSDLQLMQQLGCSWAMVTGLDGGDEKEQHCAENYIRIKERFAAFDVQVYRIAHSRVHNVPEITLNQEGRDERIDEFCRFIEELAKAGIYYNTYAHMATGIWSSGQVEGRGGTIARVCGSDYCSRAPALTPVADSDSS